jgi:hypothetical protein
MPGRKPTTDEVAEQIELCRSMLLRRVPKSTIKKAFRQRFGAETLNVMTRRRLVLAAALAAAALGGLGGCSPTTCRRRSGGWWAFGG